MITIHERLSRIEQQNREQYTVLNDIKKLLHGNGSEGLITRVNCNTKGLTYLSQWKTRHEKNIKWWAVFATTIVILSIGLLEFCI